MWRTWLFLIFLATIPVTLACGLYEKLRPSLALRRAFVVSVLLGLVTLLPIMVDIALRKPAFWIAVVVLAALLALGPVMWRDAGKRRA